jgi:hypothetical protein
MSPCFLRLSNPPNSEAPPPEFSGKVSGSAIRKLLPGQFEIADKPR